MENGNRTEHSATSEALTNGTTHSLPKTLGLGSVAIQSTPRCTKPGAKHTFFSVSLPQGAYLLFLAKCKMAHRATDRAQLLQHGQLGHVAPSAR